MKKTILTLAGCLLAGVAFGQTTLPNKIDSNTTLESGMEYIISGYTYVLPGNTLTIEPGVVIYAEDGTGANASALVISRGAQIMAMGTMEDPIIMTSILDDPLGSLTEDDTSLWGGLVVLGNATLNSRKEEGGTAPFSDVIEGFDPPAEDVPLLTYGGTEDDDNSGVISFVSLRHGGIALGGGDEINGLTMGGVGNATVVNNVEIFANKDDQVELFGGTVDLTNIVMAFGYDDGLDLDQGWRGRVQNLFIIQTERPDDLVNEAGDNGGEWDGDDNPAGGTPFMQLWLSNATFIGNGEGNPANTAMRIKANGAAKVWNSVFVDYETMIRVDDDSEARLTAGDIELLGNVFWSHIAGNNENATLLTANDAVDETSLLTDATNDIANPMLGGISRTADGGLNPFPEAGSPALSGAVDVAAVDPWFTNTSYRGAFGPLAGVGINWNWAAGWTKLSQDGYFADVPGVVASETYGLVYTTTGALEADAFIYDLETGTWSYIATEDDTGYWSYNFK